MNKHIVPLLFGATLLAGAFTSGCAVRAEGRVRYYDRDHEDWHRWDNREDQEYRRYIKENRREYREFRELNDEEKRDYWNWRHQNGEREGR